MVHLSFISCGLFGQRTVISGVAPGAERRIIRVSAPGDLITFWEKPLATSVIDSAGHFSLSVDLDVTTNVIIAIDFHKTELFLEPAKTYSVAINAMNYDDYSEIDPFIQSQNLALELTNHDPQELNALISAFNQMSSAFLMKNFNALYRERRKVLLDTFRVAMNQHFGSVKNAFFLDYAAYKIAAMEQLSQYYNQAQLAKKYFTDKPVLYDNPGYMDFFNNFFAKYITATSNTIRKVDFTALLRGADPYKAILKAMTADTVLKKEQLRELVMLKGMMELYNSPGYSQDEVLRVITSVSVRTKYPENRIVAENMISQLTNLKPGSKAPGFTLPDAGHKELSLSSLLGKPVVLWFWTTYCDVCLSEMDLVRPLYDRFGDKIHFVGISADKYFSKMLYFINLKKDYVWTSLHIGDHYEVLTDYDVRTYPLFVLIDREGKIIKYPAGLPGSGLETDLQNISEE